MLDKKLISAVKLKGAYFHNQASFYKELAGTYPYVIKADMGQLLIDIEKELHLLLCNALRFKSIKIELKGKDRYNPDITTISVQRSVPGFYFNYSQRGSSDINYLSNSHYLDNNDDMFSAKDGNREKVVPESLVMLSKLKEPSKQIDPIKIDSYFKILREVMAYKSKALAYTGNGRNVKDKTSSCYSRDIIVNNLRLLFTEKSFEVDLKRNFGKNSSRYYGNGLNYSSNETDVFRMLDYEDGRCNSNFSQERHEVLKVFSDSFYEIKEALELEEKHKKNVYKTCESFLEQIKIHTTPFKVLNELIKK